jgi:iron complex outermembrane receptor protein
MHYFLFECVLNHSICRRLMLAAVFFSIPSLFFAQDFKVDTARLKTVVIQATRVNGRNPVPHTNLVAADIAKTYQAQDVPFLLAKVPGLVENSDAGTGIGYTGMRIRGSDPTRINVTINGIPLNDAESQAVYWVNLPDLAASAAEIQVQRGVGTSTNGAGAFGASVNVDLSRIQADPFATFTQTLGSFNTRKSSMYAGTGLLKGKFSLQGRISTIQSDGYIDRARANLNAGHLSANWIGTKQSLQANLLFGKEETYQAWNGVPAQYVDDPVLRRYNTAGTERPGTPYADEIDHYAQRHYLLHYTRMLGAQLALQLNAHYTRGLGYYEQYKAAQSFTNYGIEDIKIGDSLVTQTDLIRRLWLDNHFYGSTFALRWNPTNAAKKGLTLSEMLLGGGLHRYEGRHYGDIVWAQWSPVPKDWVYYDNRADKLDANVYLKTEAEIGKGWTAMLDVQYRFVQYQFLGYDNLLRNVNQSVDLHFFNPKVGISKDLGSHLNAYCFAGIGNREPNRDDFTQSTPSSRPRPERLYDLETGLKGKGQYWNVAANFYWMHYRDQLVLDGRINNVGAYIRTNIAQSDRIGLELEGSVQAGDVVSFNAQAAFSKNTVRAFTAYVDDWDAGTQIPQSFRNTPLSFSPGLVASAEAVVQVLPAKAPIALSVALSGKHVGKQYLDNTGNENTILKGYFFSNLRFNVELNRYFKQPLRLICTVQNLFNARYSANGWTYRYISAGYDARGDNPYTRLEGNNTYHQSGFFPQAGRNWMATLQWTIGN